MYRGAPRYIKIARRGRRETRPELLPALLRQQCSKRGDEGGLRPHLLAATHLELTGAHATRDLRQLRRYVVLHRSARPVPLGGGPLLRGALLLCRRYREIGNCMPVEGVPFLGHPDLGRDRRWVRRRRIRYGAWRLAGCGLRAAPGGCRPRIGPLCRLVYNRFLRSGRRRVMVVDREEVGLQRGGRRGWQRCPAIDLVLGLVGPPWTARSTLHEFIIGMLRRFWLVQDKFVDRWERRRRHGARPGRQVERTFERVFDTVDHEFRDQRKRLARDTRRRRHEWWKHSGQVNSPNSLCPAGARTAQGPPPPAPARRRAELLR